MHNINEFIKLLEKQELNFLEKINNSNSLDDKVLILTHTICEQYLTNYFLVNYLKDRNKDI